MSENPARPAVFNWHHEALDRVCRQLPEFGAALLVAEDPTDLDFLWKQAERRLIPSSEAEGMAVEHFRWDSAEKERLKERIHTQLIDAIFVRVDEKKEPALGTSCEELSIWPCGLVLFAAKSPEAWYDLFDFRITFRDGHAEIQHADGTPSQEYPCALGAPTKSAEQHEGTAARADSPLVGLVGVDADLSKLLETVLRKEGLRAKAIQEDLTAGTVPPALLASSWSALERRKFSLEIASRTTLLLLGNAQMRQEDRIAAYRSGATLVLPSDADPAEIVAALLAQLNIRKPTADPFHRIDENFSMLSQRMKRDLRWNARELDRASQYYLPLLELLMRRAVITRTPVGALVLPLPAPPSLEAAGQPGAGWAKMMVHNLVSALIGSVRPRDITLIVENRLVIIAHPMNGLTERSLVMRMEQLTQDLEETGAKPRTLQSQIPALNDTSAEAKRFLGGIFQAL